jgi:hypothetical protein
MLHDDPFLKEQPLGIEPCTAEYYFDRTNQWRTLDVSFTEYARMIEGGGGVKIALARIIHQQG